MVVDPMLHHIVLLQFNPTTSVEEIATVERAFRALPATIAAIADLRWGSAVSVGSEYSYCLMITSTPQQIWRTTITIRRIRRSQHTMGHSFSRISCTTTGWRQRHR